MIGFDCQLFYVQNFWGPFQYEREKSSEVLYKIFKTFNIKISGLRKSSMFMVDCGLRLLSQYAASEKSLAVLLRKCSFLAKKVLFKPKLVHYSYTMTLVALNFTVQVPAKKA